MFWHEYWPPIFLYKEREGARWRGGKTDSRLRLLRKRKRWGFKERGKN